LNFFKRANYYQTPPGKALQILDEFVDGSALRWTSGDLA